jgi:hypothetical protein
MGACVPVHPRKVDSLGIEWRRRESWWFEGAYGSTVYVATFGMRCRDSWDVQFSDGSSPMRQLQQAAASVVVDSLVSWLASAAAEVRS